MDLLQPTITHADDAVDFDRPFQPMWMVYLTPILGLLFTGSVLVYNYGRLGMGQRRVPAAIFVVLASAVLFFGSIILLDALLDENGESKSIGFVRIGMIVLATLVCYLLARDQTRRHRIFEHANLPKPSWQPVILAGVAWFFISPEIRKQMLEWFLRNVWP